VTDTNVFRLYQAGTFTDPLSEVLRNGARSASGATVEAAVSSILSCHADELTDHGGRRLVRRGHLPERPIITGIGPVAVRCPRVRDRGGQRSERIRFRRRFVSLRTPVKEPRGLIPILYLKRISTGDFEDALIALLGRDAGGPSASTIGRLEEAWSEEHARWSNVTFRPNATSTSGSTAFTCRPVSKRPHNAY
jgi:putative transposase